jgi:hypothetical protein
MGCSFIILLSGDFYNRELGARYWDLGKEPAFPSTRLQVPST